MPSVRPHRLLRSCIVAIAAECLILAQTGCISAPPDAFFPELPPPPSEAERASFGIVGVVHALTGTFQEMDRPPTGLFPKMGVGAIEGLRIYGVFFSALDRAGSVGGGSNAGYAGMILIVLIIALLPVSMIIGALIGPLLGLSSAEVEKATESLSIALAETNPQVEIASNVASLIGTRTAYEVKFLGPYDCSEWPEGIDTLLVIEGPQVFLEGRVGMDPSLALRVEVPFRVLKRGQKDSIYKGSLWHDGAVNSFLGWSDNDGAQLRSGINQVMNPAFGERILEEVFLLHLLPSERLVPEASE